MINRKTKRVGITITFLLIVLYAGFPRILSVSNGLPYHHFWDEPSSATGALVSMKTNNFFPHGQGLVYGGAIRYPLMLVDYIYYQYLRISPQYLVDRKSDIKTYLEGVYKTTSHSGFYYWSRTFVVVINVLAFLFVFEIGRLRKGYATGLIAVVILASIFLYYERSFLVNVDLPLSTWMLGAIYFSLRFDRDKSKRDFYLSLICVGLAGATKYTGAITFIIPLATAIINRKEFNWSSRSDIAKSVLKWGGICFGVFAILNPTTIVFPDRMFKTILWIGMVYKTGQGHFSKEPGIEHLTYQISQLVEHYGSLFIAIACVGLLIGIIRLGFKRWWTGGTNTGFLIIVLFPCFYLFYITFIYMIAYHRNFSLMYPILALLSAEAIAILISWVVSISPRFVKVKPVVEIMAIGLFFYLSYPGYSNIMKTAKGIFHSVETRTRAILYTNQAVAQGSQVFLGISDDLLVSPEDLRKLDCDYGFFKITDLDSALEGFTHLLLPDLQSHLQVSNFDSLKQSLDSIVAEHELARIGDQKLAVPATLSDHENPIFNPTVIILQGADFPPPNMKDFKLPLERREAEVLGDHRPVEIISSYLDPGNYVLTFDSRGESALGEYPIAKVFVDTDTLATIITNQNFVESRVEFKVESEERTNIMMVMTNDYYDEEKGLDRNAFLRRIEVRDLEKGL